MKINNRGNWSLIGLLVSAAIIGVVIFLMMGKGTGPSSVKSDSKMIDQASQKKTVYGKAIDTGKGVDCQERLRQIRSGVQMFKDSSSDGVFPPTLKDAGLSVGDYYYNCPVSNQPYVYDQQSGSVHCPYPGHANF